MSNGGSRVQWDVYRVLGVSRRAAHPQIKAAFHTLAKAYHPDVRPEDQAAEERFKEITAAYGILKRKETRVRYDRSRSRRRNAFLITAFLGAGLPLLSAGFVATAVWLRWHASPGEHAPLASVVERDEAVHASRTLSGPLTEPRDPPPEHPASTEAVQDGREAVRAAPSIGSQAPQDTTPGTETTLQAALPAETLPARQVGGTDADRKHEEPAGSTRQEATSKPASRPDSGRVRKIASPPNTYARAAGGPYTAERAALRMRVTSPGGHRFIDPAGTSR
jgi:curved DNA-binding protein CbpA